MDPNLLARFGAPNALVATKEGLLICAAPGTSTDVPAEFARQLEILLPTDRSWRVGIGRPHSGPGGIVRSYEEAQSTLDLAGSLGLSARRHHATDLLVFQVLLRDRAVIVDLVATVLGPLDTH